MALITDLPATSSLASTDVLIEDTGSATQKITLENFLWSLGLPRITVRANIDSASTNTYTLVNNHVYAVSISRYGTTSNAGQGFYIINCRTSSSNIKDIVAAGNATVTVNGTTLTVTTTASNHSLVVIDLRASIGTYS